MKTNTVLNAPEEESNQTQVAAPKKTFKDALTLAAKNREFGELLVSNPEQLKGEYNLTESQITQIKGLRKLSMPGDDGTGMVVTNYEDFGG